MNSTVTPEPPDAMPIWARLRLNLTPVPYADVTAWQPINDLLGHAYTEYAVVSLSRHTPLA